MRFGMTVLALAACAAWAVPALAQDAPASKEADLGRHLLVASEAKLEEGKTLIAQGRVAEGLAALREISGFLRRHEALLRSGLADPPAAPRARVNSGPRTAPVVPAPLGPQLPVEPQPPAAGTPGAAVEAALNWLAQHQSEDGSWKSKSFARDAACECRGRGSSDDYTVGVTGLALLAFVNGGHTMRHGAHKDVVNRACKFLKSVQTPDGCIGEKVKDGHYMYSHAVALRALAEAYGMSGMTPSLRGSVQKGMEFLLSAQNPYLGWRYGIRPGDNDSSVTAWAVMALKACKSAGFKVPDHAFQGARNWFDKVTDNAFYKTGYVQKGDNGARLPEAQKYQPTEAMTAAALTCRRLMGQDPEDKVIRGGLTLLVNMPPKWDAKSGNDFYYWYFGTMACAQDGGRTWRKWAPKLRYALMKNQRRGGHQAGSWDTDSAWGGAGGRVYTTAINCLSLAAYRKAEEKK